MMLSLSFVAAPSFAQAQPSQTDAKAVSLFKEARALMEKGQYAEACPKLEDSLRIDPGMGTLFNLSDCYEHIGRMASAWTGFRDVAAVADAAGKGSRAQAARERAAVIEPKLSKIRIAVSPEAASSGVEVQRNGVAVGKLLWGTEVPVDPGTYLVSASAPGKASWSATAIVEEPGKVVTVMVPGLAPVKAAAPEKPLAHLSSPFSPPMAPPSESKNAGPAILLGGIAAAGVGGGVALLVVSSSKQSEALRLRESIPQSGGGSDNACLATPKPAGCADLESSASSAATMRSLAIGSFVLGGAGLAGMAIYLLVPPSAKSSPSSPLRSLRVLPVLPVHFAEGGSSGGIVAAGSF